MKRTLTLLLALAMLLALCACGGNTEPEPTPEVTPEPTKEEIEMMIAKDMASTCADKLRRTLKDPNSFQLIEVNSEKQVFKYYEDEGFFLARFSFVYTATNSYGGRVQDTCYCAGWGYYNQETGNISYDALEIDIPLLFAMSNTDYINSVYEQTHGTAEE